MNEFKFIHPFTSIVAGATSSGKTEFTKLLIKNWKILFDIKTNSLKVLWCFSETKSIFKNDFDSVQIEFHKGIPSLQVIDNFNPHLIILDDLMDELNQEIKNLFTKISHHRNMSVILLVQNLFNQNKQMRTISLNSHYIIFMQGIRSNQQIEYLGRQIFPGKSKELLKIFEFINKVIYKEYGFGYLIIDLHPRSKDKYRLRTRIFPEELTASLINKHSFAPIFFVL